MRTNSWQISPNYGDEISIKETQIQDIKFMVDKEIGNNVQTVPYTVGTGPDEKYALYNMTRDHITTFNGTVVGAYVPQDPCPWLGEF